MADDDEEAKATYTWISIDDIEGQEKPTPEGEEDPRIGEVRDTKPLTDLPPTMCVSVCLFACVCDSVPR